MGSFTAIFRGARSRASPQEEVTLDQDATFIETETRGSLYNYQGKRSYEALNVYCPEYDLAVPTEFRDGNVNPGHGRLEQLQGVLAHPNPQFATFLSRIERVIV